MTAALVVLTVVGLTASSTRADVVFGVSAAGVKTSALQGQPGTSTENLSGFSLGTLPASGTFANGPYTTTGAVVFNPNESTFFDQTGKPVSVFSGRSLTVSLTQRARYLGFYWAGGDSGNLIDLYDGGTLLGTFSSNDLGPLLSPAYFAPDYNNQPFAYVNLTLSDPSFSFTAFTLRQANNDMGFEFQNLTTSFAVPPVPEPSTYAMALAGLACGGYLVRRRRKRA